jgi:hypothetical protein
VQQQLLNNRSMSFERFPRAMYVRQLKKVRSDLWWWSAAYMQSAIEQQDQIASARLEDRAHVLDDAMHQLLGVIDTLDQLPRLS